MKIKIIKSNEGCVYEVGQIIKMPENRANKLIQLGFAKPIKDSEYRPEKGIPTVSYRKRGETRPVNTTMKPPRLICRCGLICNTVEELKAHQAECK